MDDEPQGTQYRNSPSTNPSYPASPSSNSNIYTKIYNNNSFGNSHFPSAGNLNNYQNAAPTMNPGPSGRGSAYDQSSAGQNPYNVPHGYADPSSQLSTNPAARSPSEGSGNVPFPNQAFSYPFLSAARPESHSGGFPQSKSEYPPAQNNDEPEWHTVELPTSRIDIRRDDNYEPQWDGVIATRDTGTEENWIDIRIVERCGLQVISGLIGKWTTFNGQILTSCETVNPTWCVSGGRKTHKNVFRVVANPPFDVLFGRNFLNRHSEVLSSKNSTQDSPLQVLVQKKVKRDEKKTIEENRKNVREESAQLVDSRQNNKGASRDGGQSSRSGGTSGSQKQSTSHKKGKSRDSKR